MAKKPFDKKRLDELNSALQKSIRRGLEYQALHFTVKKDAISSHIKNCMNIQVSQQRTVEKEIRRKSLRKIGQKLSGFFIPKKKESMIPTECPHIATTSFQSMHDGNIYTKCLECGKILGSFNPHKKQTKIKNDLLILESLRK